MKQFLAITMVLPALLSTCSAICENTLGSCAAGCWRSSETAFDNATTKLCQSVGEGFYSPDGSDERFPCADGTFSGKEQAETCETCPPGSISGRGMASCVECPSGFYQDKPGRSACLGCLPGYEGKGANSFVYMPENNTVLCDYVDSTDTTPTAAPSSMASQTEDSNACEGCLSTITILLIAGPLLCLLGIMACCMTDPLTTLCVDRSEDKQMEVLQRDFKDRYLAAVAAHFFEAEKGIGRAHDTSGCTHENDGGATDLEIAEAEASVPEIV